MQNEAVKLMRITSGCKVKGGAFNCFVVLYYYSALRCTRAYCSVQLRFLLMGFTFFSRVITEIFYPLRTRCWTIFYNSLIVKIRNLIVVQAFTEHSLHLYNIFPRKNFGLWSIEIYEFRLIEIHFNEKCAGNVRMEIYNFKYSTNNRLIIFKSAIN